MEVLKQTKKGCRDQIKNGNIDIRGFLSLSAETWVNMIVKNVLK